MKKRFLRWLERFDMRTIGSADEIALSYAVTILAALFLAIKLAESMAGGR